jgi:hypothetical protein
MLEAYINYDMRGINLSLKIHSTLCMTSYEKRKYVFYPSREFPAINFDEEQAHCRINEIICLYDRKRIFNSFSKT